MTLRAGARVGTAAALAVTAGALLLPASAVGSLRQLDGADGCVSPTGADGCALGGTAQHAWDMAFSPDGLHLYVAKQSWLLIYERDPVTGALRLRPGRSGCVNDYGGDCVRSRGAYVGFGVAVSPDGTSLYSIGGTLGVFRRDRDGTLAPLRGAAGCLGLLPELTPRGRCTRTRGVSGGWGVAVSPDGRAVYATGPAAQAVAIFSRDSRSGALRQLRGRRGCISAERLPSCARGRALDNPQWLLASEDGRHVYAIGGGGTVAAFKRSRRTGGLRQAAGANGCWGWGACEPSHFVTSVYDAALSGDGRHLYLASLSAPGLVVLSRNQLSGALTSRRGPLGCVGGGDQAYRCASAPGFHRVGAIALSPDGQSAYATTANLFEQNLLGTFARDPVTGALQQVVSGSGCFAGDPTDVPSGCSLARGMRLPGEVAVSPDGRHVYVSSVDGSIAAFARVLEAPS